MAKAWTHHACLIALTVGLSFLGWLESPATPPNSDIHDSTPFVLSSWHVEDGLPHETVNAILQSSSGFLWLGTENGLWPFARVGFLRLGLEDGLANLRR